MLNASRNPESQKVIKKQCQTKRTQKDSKLHHLRVLCVHVAQKVLEDKRRLDISILRLRAARTLAAVLIVLVDVEAPSDLLAPAVEVGLEVNGELAGAVGLLLLLVANSAIKLALDAI